MTPPDDVAALFRPFDLTPRLRLPNRIVLAPCTRNRAEHDLSPTPGAIDHYADRAAAGLLITEAVLISHGIQGYVDTPGIFTDAHQAAWAKVATAVHERGGRIFMQLWHPGRMAHSHFHGVPPRAPSAVFDPGPRRQTRVSLEHEPPVPLSEGEISGILCDYEQAAQRAIAAGFDGVEIHGANGYLPEQFWRMHTNRRTDGWGGTPERRARFCLALCSRVAAAIGPDRVGLRLSPMAYFSEMKYMPGDNLALDVILSRLSGVGLAYVHTGIIDDKPEAVLGGTCTQYLRARWPGVLVTNGALTPEKGAALVAAGEAELAAFGKLFLANADLVARLSQGMPLEPYSRAVLDRFT
ncbi:MAG: alkene reductase [Pararhodobacter sp.]|nr:alkene reductase [Pararhodobacter sp.]